MGTRTRLPDMRATWRARAEAEAARVEARRVVVRWNEEIAAGRDMVVVTNESALRSSPVCRGSTFTALAAGQVARSMFAPSTPPAGIGRQSRAWAAVLVVLGIGTHAADHGPSPPSAGNCAPQCSKRVKSMPTEFMFGRILSSEELDMIREQIESMDEIGAVTDEVRRIVERNWPHLLAKLPPKDE